MYSKARSGVLVALAVMLGVAAFVLPAQPALAQAGTPQAPLISSVGCTLTVEFAAAVTTSAYNVQIWDDGVQVFSQSQTATTVGQVLSFTYTFTSIGTAAPGVGIDVFEGGALAFTVDPYTDLDQTCNPAAGCPIGFPSGSVVGAFVAPAPVYSVPGQLVEAPPVTIEAGKTAWVIGLDASGQYYKIFWACDFLWVPANTMGPNFDQVWNGTPLPTRTVES
jgi:hypothetical protein